MKTYVVTDQSLPIVVGVANTWANAYSMCESYCRELISRHHLENEEVDFQMYMDDMNIEEWDIS